MELLTNIILKSFNVRFVRYHIPKKLLEGKENSIC
jgi:DNA-directed RNA polymerase subunit L